MTEYRWIDTSEALADEVRHWDADEIAVDTEADSFYRYGERICLIQVATAGRHLLIDAEAELELGPLRGILEKRTTTKLLHGADFDLRLLQRELTISVEGIFDTMIAARLVGERSFGLAALLEKFFDVRLDKKFQRADWSVRPLPEPMCRYAVEDVRHLGRLRETLDERLRALDRSSWAEEEFRRLESASIAAAHAESEPGWRRLRGAGRLDRVGLAVLREVWTVRDEEARRRDRAAFRILPNEVLLALAQERPRARAEIERIPRMPGPWRTDERANRLLDAVRRACALGEDELPERRRRSDTPPDPDFERKVKELGRRRNRLADELDLEPGVLAPRALLEQAVRLAEEGADPGTSERMRAWQRPLILPLVAEVA